MTRALGPERCGALPVFYALEIEARRLHGTPGKSMKVLPQHFRRPGHIS